MARPLRIHFNGALYHVTARGNEKKSIYFSRSDYEKFKYYINKARDKFKFLLHGFVFLDEIAEMDPNLQTKLLRFLPDKEFTPLGSTKSIRAEVRIIGATNRDLSEAAARGAFREDLYYRFNVVQIKVPPLRDRKEDIPLLIKSFLRDAAEKFETGEKELSKEAKVLLTKYDWPGNVRELENVIKRACVLSAGTMIEKRDLLLEEDSAYSIKEFLEEKLKRYLNVVGAAVRFEWP